MSALYRL
jgi:TolA-binding protein